MSKKTAFKTNKLNLWYGNGKNHALKDISISLAHQSVTALIGPSGCGKSTFLRCLNRMNDLIEGVKISGSVLFSEKYQIIQSNDKISFRNFTKSITFQKKSNAISPIELRIRVGMVFQKPNPFSMTIFDNVAFGPKNAGIKSKLKLQKIVENALKNAALWNEVKDRLGDSALSLSGGQQQRLCIARTIAMEPEVILMDEPTSALDPIATNKIEELITQLKNKYTIIIVTHSMQQAARISDQTAFFYLGKLIEMDTTKKIFTNPMQKLTNDYITGKMG